MNAIGLRLALALLVVCATLIPRLLMLGAPPATDEGIFAFNALMIYLNPPPGNLLPDFGTLSLYSALLSWVFCFDINHLVSLRALDAVVATLAGWMFYQVISYESNNKIAGAVIAVIFLITLNDPVFIQYGFKNSIAAASLPLLAAIAIGQRITLNNSFGWFSVGGLVAIAVLLREPFAAIAIAGLFAVYFRAGWVGVRNYMLGGGLIGGVLLLAFILMRGGYHNLIKNYADLTLIYQGISYQKKALLESSSLAFTNNAMSALMLSMVAIYWILLASAKKPEFIFRLGFWLLLASTPLIEPLLKNGYPYHFATSLFGLAGVVALGWQAFSETRGERLKPTYLIVFFAILFLTPKFGKFNAIYTQYTAQLNTEKSSIHWPVSTVQQSNYLLIADHIHTQRQNNPTLAINGSMLGVIPLAKAKPSSPELAHLSYRFIHLHKDKNRLKLDIENCPPTFILLTNSSPFNDTKVLNAIVKSIPEYRLSAYIPTSNTRHYGSFDGAIYKWTGKPKSCHQNHQESGQ